MIRLKTRQWKKLAYAVIFIRLVVPLLVFFSPFWVTVIVYFLDLVDNPVYLNAKIVNYSRYQILDKFLDTYYLALLWIFSLAWNIPLLNVLFLWRIAGLVIIALTHQRKLFVAFPNVFEHVYQVLAFGMFVDTALLPAIVDNLAIIVVIITVFKLGVEAYLHYFPKYDSVLITSGLIRKNY